MSEREQSSSDFSFSGFLLFRTLKTSRNKDPDKVKFDELPKFSPGNLDQPGRGFERILSSVPDDFTDENPDLAKLARTGDFLRYISETYGSEQEVITEEGVRMSAFTVSTVDCEIVITPSNNIFVRGSSKDLERVIPELRRFFTEAYASDFDPMFLLWMFWKYFSDEEIESANPLRLTDAEMKGSLDGFGQTLVYGGEDITRSYPIILGLLRGKEFKSIEGTFNFSGKFVKTKIGSDGTIHIHAAEDIRHSSQIQRYLSAVDAADSLAHLYNKWTKMDRKEKYPPKSFYIELRDNLEESGIEIGFSISKTLERVSELRK